jgi:hypothetical protein
MRKKTVRTKTASLDNKSNTTSGKLKGDKKYKNALKKNKFI